MPLIQKLIDAQKGKWSEALPVLQFTKQGRFLAEFPSASNAATLLKINRGNLNTCLHGHLKTCGGYQWRYKNGNTER